VATASVGGCGQATPVIDRAAQFQRNQPPGARAPQKSHPPRAHLQARPHPLHHLRENHVPPALHHLEHGDGRPPVERGPVGVGGAVVHGHDERAVHAAALRLGDAEVDLLVVLLDVVAHLGLRFFGWGAHGGLGVGCIGAGCMGGGLQGGRVARGAGCMGASHGSAAWRRGGAAACIRP